VSFESSGGEAVARIRKANGGEIEIARRISFYNVKRGKAIDISFSLRLVSQLMS
jgi:hypothetical protein